MAKTKPKKSHPKHQNRKHSSDDNEEEVDDIMAWGKSKQNYYQDEADQYSQVSEQYQEAQKIYQKQQNNLQRNQFYELPEDSVSQGQHNQEANDDSEEILQTTLNEQYVGKQILWCVQLGKIFAGLIDGKSKSRTQLINSYMMVLLCLRQFKSVPYIQEHPMIQNLGELKKGLKALENQLMEMHEGQEIEEEDSQDGGENEGEDEELDFEAQEQDQLDFDQMEPEQEQKINKKRTSNVNQGGLQLYEQMKAEKQQIRKNKKAQNKQKHEKTLPKAAFRTVKQSEGRLASEKMVKNKGLMKRRKKIDGNSRVKLREKYRKAVIKRRTKGFIGVKQNPGRFYEGENKVLYGKIGSTKLG